MVVLRAWHDWAYYTLIIALIAAWMYHKFKDFWHAPKEPVSSTEQTKRRIKEDVLWAVLASAFLATALRSEYNRDQLNESLANVNSQLETLAARMVAVDSERLETARNRLDQGFNLIFGDHLDLAINHLRTAVNNKEITLGYDEFRSLYIETLDKLPGHTFLSMSIPTKKFFWGEPTIKAAVEKFTESGGHMHRIFLLDGPYIRGDEAYEIMLAQHRAKVEVYYAMRDELPPEKQGLFMVDEQCIFSWTLDVDSMSRILRATGTSNVDRSRGLISDWNYVRRHFAKEFTPDPQDAEDGKK